MEASSCSARLCRERRPPNQVGTMHGFGFGGGRGYNHPNILFLVNQNKCTALESSLRVYTPTPLHLPSYFLKF